MHLRLRLLPLLAAGLLLGVSGCGNSAAEESAVQRGDVALAQGHPQQALAEYLLAVRQGGDDAMTLARVAHTYAMMGRVDQVVGYYDQAHFTGDFVRAVGVAPGEYARSCAAALGA